MDTVIADMVNALADSLREDFEERAAIIEFDAKLPRAHAERLALLDVLHRHLMEAIEQALLPRGHRDFEDRSAYEVFVRAASFSPRILANSDAPIPSPCP